MSETPKQADETEYRLLLGMGMVLLKRGVLDQQVAHFGYTDPESGRRLTITVAADKAAVAMDMLANETKRRTAAKEAA